MTDTQETQNKFTVSVAIPAYNEEENIENIINQVLKQKQDSFVLKEIIVYLDASTDKTAQIVERITQQNGLVKLVKDNQRKGKYHRVNQAFQENKSDALILFDADIEIVGEDFIEKLILPIQQDASTSIVSAHNVVIRPKKFMERVIYTKFFIWDCVRFLLIDQQHPVNYFGTATAYSLKYTKSINIPANISDPHLFIILWGMKDNNRFRYCKDAVVLQQSILTLKDYKRFLRRTLGKKDPELEKVFGMNTDNIYYIPWKYKLAGLFQCFKMYPIYTILAVILDITMEKIVPPKANPTPVWEFLTSTKKKIATTDAPVKRN